MPPQVTQEVGQECLLALEQMRGGLLGTEHSWVALPSSSPTGRDSVANTNAPFLDRREVPPLRLLDKARAWLYNAFEDVRDSLVDQAAVPQSGLGACIAAGATAGLALLLLLSRAS